MNLLTVLIRDAMIEYPELFDHLCISKDDKHINMFNEFGWMNFKVTVTYNQKAKYVNAYHITRFPIIMDVPITNMFIIGTLTFIETSIRPDMDKLHKTKRKFRIFNLVKKIKTYHPELNVTCAEIHTGLSDTLSFVIYGDDVAQQFIIYSTIIDIFSGRYLPQVDYEGIHKKRKFNENFQSMKWWRPTYDEQEEREIHQMRCKLPTIPCRNTFISDIAQTIILSRLVMAVNFPKETRDQLIKKIELILRETILRNPFYKIEEILSLYSKVKYIDKYSTIIGPSKSHIISFGRLSDSEVKKVVDFFKYPSLSEFIGVFITKPQFDRYVERVKEKRVYSPLKEDILQDQLSQIYYKRLVEHGFDLRSCHIDGVVGSLMEEFRNNIIDVSEDVYIIAELIMGIGYIIDTLGLNKYVNPYMYLQDEFDKDSYANAIRKDMWLYILMNINHNIREYLYLKYSDKTNEFGKFLIKYKEYIFNDYNREYVNARYKSQHRSYVDEMNRKEAAKELAESLNKKWRKYKIKCHNPSSNYCFVWNTKYNESPIPRSYIEYQEEQNVREDIHNWVDEDFLYDEYHYDEYKYKLMSMDELMNVALY